MKTKKILKPIPIILVLQIILFISVPGSGANASAKQDTDGFIIQADQVVGKNMMATIINQETSLHKKETMLRIHYDQATIYGMRLTKEFNTPTGPVSITMKADGPVTIQDMTVDASALSFKGACIRASTLVPDPGLKDVVMVAHHMSSSHSDLGKLLLETTRGYKAPKKPDKLSLLKDIGLLPLNQLNEEIANIKDGNLPLTCDESSKNENKSGSSAGKTLEDAIGKAANPTKELQDTVDKVGKTVGDVSKPLKDVIDSTTKPLKDTVGAVTKPLKDAADSVTGAVDDATKPVKKTVKDATQTKVVKNTTKQVDHTLTETCDQLGRADGKVTKEVGLELVDQALKTHQPLTKLCSDKASTQNLVDQLQDNLLDDLGLSSLLGMGGNHDQYDEAFLKELKSQLLKKKDGEIIAGG
ncbi:hypothetical protein [Falsibacillus albus]|uniref:Uncharacterized protein n=1 Tax=Falsibacillus albus TaxID=2478915 RepID=A0A3L7JK44_9BACI|nr:hypothetical protein [Falsibacillus albus]RLQ91096.1 hypothetical protein D9X91_21350 [Falsibacillus albus]